jgi:CRP-like cAMP-binding protein
VITPAVVTGFGLDTALWTMALAPAALAVLGYPALRTIDRVTEARARELAPTVARLEGLGIFAGARRPVLERLAVAATEVRFAAGDTIVREGDPAGALYVLITGQVQVSARGEAGSVERPIRIMTAPAYFGEIGVLEQIPRTATVTALTECACEQIDGQELLDALMSSPPSSSLMATARGRLAVTHPSRSLTYPAHDER